MRTLDRTAAALAPVLLCGAVALAAPRVSRAQDTPAPHPLDELAWAVGEWTDASGSDRVHVTCGWSKNERFLLRQFSVVDGDDGAVLLEGTQVIGWDPEVAAIRSWTFDSEGGFGEGRWTRDGDRWLIKTSFTLSTGEKASATNVLTRTGEDTATWASINREIDGRLQPNQAEVAVVRVSSEEVADSAEAEPLTGGAQR
ncbi:MAG: hypothetical protein AAFV43_04635 [Planctomycetota bacterium]